jgi:hypothetical protein
MITVFTNPIPSATPEAPAPLSGILCASDRPLVLLPVRLETRFFQHPDAAYELRVRVYPDKIHIDSHETELTPAEALWGRHFWEQYWRAGTQADAQGAAWRQLTQRFGANRAAWIARVLRPLNPQSQPSAAVPDGTTLPVAPEFPAAAVATGEGRDESWRRAPVARLLPDRWIALAYSGAGLVVTAESRDIQRPLAVGPNPRGTPADVADDELPIGPEMRWMVDFDAAEAAGMGLRLPIPTALATTGIETLLVVGVSGSLSPGDAATRLSALLDAHHYTDGLSFLRRGVPTNNTDEARSGYSQVDAGQQVSFAAEMGDLAAIADNDSNARQLGAALGLAAAAVPEVLGRLPQAGLRHGLDQRSMNTALWAATWGYFLTNLVGLEGTGLTPDLIAWARRYFIDHVRSLGPLSALRCSRQPYGVLPVTSLDFWQAPESDREQERDAWLHGFLLRLRDSVWRAHRDAVPRLGRTAEPGADLAEIMRVDAQSNRYTTRSLLGNHYLLHLRAFMLEDLEGRGWLTTHDTVTNPILGTLGISWQPRLARATYADHPWRVAAPAIQAGEISPQRPLEPNYIAGLLAEPTIDGILNGHVQSGDSASLLHALLRHGALLEHAQAAAQILSAQGDSFDGRDTRYATLVKDAELINLLPGSQPTPTWQWQLDQVVPATTGTLTVRAYLEALTQFQAPAVAALGEFKASLAHLQSLDSEALQFLTQGVLDLASHRFDAWVTSLATKRMAALREAQPQGVYVGGYAWLENLQPAAALTSVTPPANEPGPIFAQPNDCGFIHAPSLEHATTAALLRNAHLGHDGAARAEGPFAIDLSSRRVREAQQLLNGIRQGQQLGALLGYRFERRLHELSLDQFIDDFRDIAPLAADRLGDANEPREAVAANNVVDGLLLQQRWPAEEGRLQALCGPAFGSIKNELVALDAAIDSVSDALLAESAYQLVRGNLPRTASTLQSVSQGDAPAPELEVARTPRSGVAITHRVVMLLDPAASGTAGWEATTTSPRATAEPVLNAWAARLLGEASLASCTVEQLGDADNTVVATHELRLNELALSRLDVVFSVESQASAGTLSELEQRVIYSLRLRSALPDAVRLKIRAGGDPGKRTLQDIMELARHARRLLGSARPLDGHDLDLPEHDTVVGVDLADLGARAAAAEDQLIALNGELQQQAQGNTAIQAPDSRALILRASRFGMGGAVPLTAQGDDAVQRSALQAQMKALGKGVQARVDQITRLRALPDADSDAGKRDRWLDRLHAVFGGSFVVLPLFTCVNPVDLAGAQAASTTLQGGNAMEVYSWFARSERVREPVYRLGSALRTAEVLDTGERLQLTVAQLPNGPGERWVALPALPEKPIASGRLSLVVQCRTPLDMTRPLAGLLVDEWLEVVPGTREATAIAFQFNPPDACAPQSILLAVPPVARKAWTGWDLQRVLLETLELAKLRAVDPQALGELAHYLPAMYFGLNAENAAVSTDFAPLTRP